MQFVTPLRYPGGKGRLSQFMIDLIEQNELGGTAYAEPYAGGAAIALTLLYLGYARQIYINDLNRSVYSFWYCAINQTDDLCRLINDTNINMEEWRRQRDVQDASSPSPLELAFSTFFMNRTNRSGIIRGGVIGGKDQAGKWRLDARFNKMDMIERIQKVASFRESIALSNKDAATFLEEDMNAVNGRCLIYLDPPYFVKGQQLYQNHYTGDDHALIANIIATHKHKWLVSYDNVSGVRALYSQFHQTEFAIHYSAGTRQKGSEVMIFCDDLNTPESIRPSRATAA